MVQGLRGDDGRHGKMIMRCKCANVRAFAALERSIMDRTEGAQEMRTIKNRDIPLLSRVLYIMQDVLSVEKRIEWQNERMYGITARITGMPGGKGAPSGFDAAFAAISGLSEEHKALMQAYTRELRKAEKIINGISSRTMRTFVVMLYVDALPAEAIRRELNMTRYGFDRARRAIEEAPDMARVVWRERFILVNCCKEGESMV